MHIPCLTSFYFKVELLKASAVELSIFNGIIFCECPSASNILLIPIAALQLRKTPDVSASAADVTTCFIS